MIPEYKLYHGAVLMAVVSGCSEGILIRELSEEGRSATYMIGGSLGLHVKHSTSRLRPWQFKFSRPSLVALERERQRVKGLFVVLVCRTDGMVCLSWEEASSILLPTDVSQLSIRVDRRTRHLYAVNGPAGELPVKKPNGLEPLLIQVRNLPGL